MKLWLSRFDYPSRTTSVAQLDSGECIRLDTGESLGIVKPARLEPHPPLRHLAWTDEVRARYEALDKAKPVG